MNPKNNLTIHTIEEYLKLPLNEREKRVWFWPFKWYQNPYALRLGEWDKLHIYTKKNYPVQHFLREYVYMEYFILCGRLSDLKYKIKHHIINPRKVMREVVFPPRYQDLDNIIVNFCLECVVEYVDREKCFDIIVWDNDKEHIQRARVIKEIYAYAKTGRKALQDKIDKKWELIPILTEDDWSTTNRSERLKVYKPVNLLEQEKKDLDTKYCTWVCSNREHFWV